MNDQKIHDITIIGAGPAGLTAGLFAFNKNMEVLILEGLEAGGQLRHLYPYKPVYNFPGYSIINGGELAESMIRQVRDKGLNLLEYEPAKGIETGRDGIFSILTEKQTIPSRTVLFSAGMGLLQPRTFDVPGEFELYEKNIFYAIKKITDWQGLTVAVFGGGNSAVDNALLLQEKGCRVTLIHKLTKFQAEESSVKQLQNSDCKILTGYSLTHFESGNDDKITISLQGPEGSSRQLEAERVLINIGLKPNLAFLDHLTLERKGKQLLVDTEMQTSIPGIYACGDVVTYPGKVRLIVTALGEAATAVNRAEQYLKSLKND